MERTLLICSPCWPKNLKEMSPCIWKVCADHLSVLDPLIGMLSVKQTVPFLLQKPFVRCPARSLAGGSLC